MKNYDCLLIFAVLTLLMIVVDVFDDYETDGGMNLRLVPRAIIPKEGPVKSILPWYFNVPFLVTTMGFAVYGSVMDCPLWYFGSTH